MPTAKREKYLKKKAYQRAKQLSMIRNRAERDEQIRQFIMQMHEHHFPFGDPDIQKLLKLYRTYILEGGTHEGRIYIKGINSYAFYRLHESKQFNCEVDIKKVKKQTDAQKRLAAKLNDADEDMDSDNDMNNVDV